MHSEEQRGIHTESGGLVSGISTLYPRNDFSSFESHLQSASIRSGDTPWSTVCARPSLGRIQ